MTLNDSLNKKTLIDQLRNEVDKLRLLIDKQQSQINSLTNQIDSLGYSKNGTNVHTSEQKTTLRTESEVIYHYRLKNPDGTNHNMGGVTVVFKQGKRGLYCGVAICNQNDNFNKSIGVSVAYHRMKLFIGDRIPEKNALGFKMWLANEVIGDKKVKEYFDKFGDLK